MFLFTNKLFTNKLKHLKFWSEKVEVQRKLMEKAEAIQKYFF